MVSSGDVRALVKSSGNGLKNQQYVLTLFGG